MNGKLKKDAETIALKAIAAAAPGPAVKKALEEAVERGAFPGRIILVSAGKAAWEMTRSALETLGDRIEKGVLVTKYGHAKGPLPRIRCFEGGHPIPDEKGMEGTTAALEMTSDLKEGDTVLFLLSGGGSALFEKPLIPPEELGRITSRLLASGCDIGEINTVRKRLSAVKGGRFAARCAPARVLCLALSDVLGDRPDMIASGPAAADKSTCAQAREIAERARLDVSPEARRLLDIETPKELGNTEFIIIGSVSILCRAAASACRELGYEPVMLTDRLCCEAREAGSFMASILAFHAKDGRKTAFLAGGETVVRLNAAPGRGGRNQELALAAARGIAGIKNAAVISVGSDGTDGPTDAAGGYADGDTLSALEEKGIAWARVMDLHDAYPALEAVGGLIKTGPTGTNVNDITIALIG